MKFLVAEVVVGDPVKDRAVEEAQPATAARVAGREPSGPRPARIRAAVVERTSTSTSRASAEPALSSSLA